MRRKAYVAAVQHPAMAAEHAIYIEMAKLSDTVKASGRLLWVPACGSLSGFSH